MIAYRSLPNLFVSESIRPHAIAVDIELRLATPHSVPMNAPKNARLMMDSPTTTDHKP